MWSSRAAFENDSCPVNDDLLGAMYRASENGLSELTSSVPADVRAMLALFCYKRSHLHGLGVAIAASCSEQELVQQGGRVGSALYALSREAENEDRRGSSRSNKRGISLSTTPLTPLAALDDDLDDDLDDAMDDEQALPSSSES